MIFKPLYFEMLNNAKVASACSYVRRCRKVRNSQNIAPIRDLKMFFCVNSTISEVIYLLNTSFKWTTEIKFFGLFRNLCSCKPQIKWTCNSKKYFTHFPFGFFERYCLWRVESVFCVPHFNPRLESFY